MNRTLKPVVIITEVLLFLLIASCEFDISPTRTGSTLISFKSATIVIVESQNHMG